MSTQGQGDVVGPPNTRFVSKPVEIEAHRIGIDPWPDAAWEAVTRNEIRLYDCGKPDGYIIVRTLEGEMRGNHGDWLIRGTEGEFYPCKPSVFERKYEARTLLSSSRGEQGWRETLEWYAEQARLARLIHSEGDAGRHALADDGGKRARAVLDATPAPGSVPTSLAGQVPDGYVLVPKEPTEEMLVLGESNMDMVQPESCGPNTGASRREELRFAWYKMLSAAPQPTAGGDAPTIAYGSFPDDEPERCPRCGNAWKQPDPFALADGIDRAIKKAVSAERARVIEECAKVAETEAATARSRGALDISQEYTAPLRVAAALRALGQQDTGGAG